MKKLRIEARLMPSKLAEDDCLEVEMTPAVVADLIAGLGRMLAQAPPPGICKTVRFCLFGEVAQHVEGWVPLNTVPATLAVVPLESQDEGDDE